MVHAITNAHHPEPTTASMVQAKSAGNSATSSQKLTQSHTASPAGSPTDTVQVSSAGRVALKETLETPAQTAKEAASGDHQAQRLLAKEAAAEKA